MFMLIKRKDNMVSLRNKTILCFQVNKIDNRNRGTEERKEVENIQFSKFHASRTGSDAEVAFTFPETLFLKLLVRPQTLRLKSLRI